MSEHKLHIGIAFHHAAGDEPRHRHGQIELARENYRQHIILHQAVALGRKCGMHEYRHRESIYQFEKRRKLFGVERKSLDLWRDCYAFEPKPADRAIQFFQAGSAIKNRRVRKADKTTWIVLLQPRGAIIEQSAVLEGRVPAKDAALHGDVDAGAIHIADLRFEIEQLRMHGRIARANRFFLRRVHP